MNVYIWTSGVLKNAYIGEVYEYSYDFRGKTESQIYNDWWSKFRGSVQINSSWITALSGTDFVLTYPVNLSSANKITVQASIVFNSSYTGTGHAMIYWLSSTSTPQQNNAVFFIASSASYGGTRTRIVANWTASEWTNVWWIGKSSYTPNLIIDLTNKTMSWIVDWKISTYTLTDTQVSNIRNLNGIYLYCTQANFYISNVKLTVE